MNLNGKISQVFQASATKSQCLSTSSDPINKSISVSLANGISANQGNKCYQNCGETITGETWAKTYNLWDGTLEDVFGDSANMQKIKSIYVRNLSGETGELDFDANLDVFIDGAGNEFKGPLADVVGDKIILAPGEWFVLSKRDLSGWTVDATHKFFNLSSAASATGCSFEFVIVGIAK